MVMMAGVAAIGLVVGVIMVIVFYASQLASSVEPEKTRNLCGELEFNGVGSRERGRNFFEIKLKIVFRIDC